MKRYQNSFILTLLAAAACGPIGAIAYKLQPDPTVEAKYKLQDRPTAILVENFRNPDIAATDAELLTRNLSDRLKDVVVDKKPLVHVVAFEKVIDLRDAKPKAFFKMTIPQIGTAVGAEQVIYVDLQAGGVAPMATGEVLQGKASAQVKVVDVATGDTLWPTEMADGFPVTTQTNPLEGQSAGTYNAVREQLYEDLADKIAKLFYKYSVSTDHPSKIDATN